MDALVKNATQRTPIGVDQHLVIEPGQTVNVPNWGVLREKPATAARLECGDLVEVDAPAVDTEEVERQRVAAAEAEAERKCLEDEERQRVEAEEAERQRVAAAEAAAAANKQKPHVPTPRR